MHPLDIGINPNNNTDGGLFGCDNSNDNNISPLCVVTVKAMLLDHTNYYLLGPLVTCIDNLLKISEIRCITPNLISFVHVLIAIISAKCISGDNLMQRRIGHRIGVVLFEFRTFLDDFDGHVARTRKHIRGERSEIGTSGYFIDGICDALGCTALMIGVFVYLKNNLPRRGSYMLLPTTTNNNNNNSDSIKGNNNVVKTTTTTTHKVVTITLCFVAQLIISSSAWNRYIALYQGMLERSSISNNSTTETLILKYYYSKSDELIRQNVVFQSTIFFCIAWLWRVLNIHNMLHCLLLAIFCDKLWEFLRNLQYLGFGVLFAVICATEVHVIDVEKFVFSKQYYRYAVNGAVIT